MDKKILSLILIFIAIGLFCFFSIHQTQSFSSNKNDANKGKDIGVDFKIAALDASRISDIATPTGYDRIQNSAKSFGLYLQNLKLKKDNQVHLYDGTLKINQEAQYRVIDIDIGKQNLQQCADAVIRLRAEYLFSQKQYSKINFHFTNGQLAQYEKFAQGFRAKISGNKITWVKTAKVDYSYNNFRKYLDLVFNYAGTSSLAKELKKVDNINDLNIGDVFVQVGNPYGHAVIIVDVAVNKKTGKKIFLLAQSYMPAQEIHILKNPNDPNLSPWYSDDFRNELVTPEWVFQGNDLKSF